jgi:AraC-like DNA-binding protein
MGSIMVPAGLRPWVSGIDMTAADGTAVVDAPDHATTLVVRNVPGQRPEVMVMGPRTRAGYHETESVVSSCVRIRMRPGRAQAVIGRPVRDLTDRAWRVTDLPGLALDGFVDDPIAALMAALAGRSPKDDLVTAAEELLSGADVAGTARRLHVSERRLRTLFADGVGLSPKHFARIGRVRAVLAAAPTRPLADVATATGYYDQSHMTAEFRQVMGVPPAAFVAGRRPPATRCR